MASFCTIFDNYRRKLAIYA